MTRLREKQSVPRSEIYITLTERLKKKMRVVRLIYKLGPSVFLRNNIKVINIPTLSSNIDENAIYVRTNRNIFIISLATSGSTIKGGISYK